MYKCTIIYNTIMFRYCVQDEELLNNVTWFYTTTSKQNTKFNDKYKIFGLCPVITHYVYKQNKTIMS